MLSLFRLRRTAPELERTYLAPGYPVIPAIALVLACVCLLAMLWFNPLIGTLFIALMAAAYIYFLLTKAQRFNAPQDDMSTIPFASVSARRRRCPIRYCGWRK